MNDSFDEDFRRLTASENGHTCFFSWGTAIPGRKPSEVFIVLYCSCGTTVGQEIDFDEVSSDGQEER